MNNYIYNLVHELRIQLRTRSCRCDERAMCVSLAPLVFLHISPSLVLEKKKEKVQLTPLNYHKSSIFDDL